MKNKSLVFIMSSAIMPIPLKKGQRFSICKIEINRPLAESRLLLCNESNNGITAKKPIFFDTSGKKINWIEHLSPIKALVQESTYFELEKFRKGDEIKIHYNLTK